MNLYAKSSLSLALIVFSFTVIHESNIETKETSSWDWLFNIIDEDPMSSYNYAYNITWITTDITLSGYSYRSSGSIGEYNIFLYIKNKLQEFGLNVTVEEFDFINWGIYNEPNMTLLIDNQIITSKIYPVHLTYGTSKNGLYAEIVYLPLPQIFTYSPLPSDIISIWNSIDTTNKIILIGREVLYNDYWKWDFLDKISAQKPKAILYTWATIDFKNYPIIYHSTEGRSLSLFRNNKIPIAWVNKTTAQTIISAINNNQSVAAILKIPVEEGLGKVRNIIASIQGKDKSRTILLTAHYDSVMVPALSDNAAGVAGLLELAYAFSKAYKNNIYTPPVNITFVFFTSEEAGLIGSAKYVEMHKEELGKIIGVINLDTLGSYKIEISPDPVGFYPKNSTNKIHLHEIVLDAIKTMGLNYTVGDAGLHSDDSTFYMPEIVEDLISGWWPSFPINIRYVRKVPAMMISSTPYLYWDTDINNNRGLIHTSYDNTTSTQTYDWVNPQRLELQIKVAGLSVIKLLEYFKVTEEGGTTSGNGTSNETVTANETENQTNVPNGTNSENGEVIIVDHPPTTIFAILAIPVTLFVLVVIYLRKKAQ